MRGWKRAGNILKLAGESISFVFASFSKNRLRGFLSLLGVCIGIFCITAAMTIVESLERSLKQSLESFGGNAVFIERIPLEPDLNEDGVFRWWNYLGRPEPTYEEYEYLKKRLSGRASVSFSSIFEDGRVVAVSEDWRNFIKNAVGEGREFSSSELSEGIGVAMIGANVAEKENSDIIFVGSKAVRVIGIFEKCGAGSVDMCDIDNAVAVPCLWTARTEGLKADKKTVTVLPTTYGEDGEMLAEIEAALRAYRRLRPGTPSDFSLNRLSFIMEEMEKLFRILGSIAWIIGLFSLLVGGFGVANIMFVSVKERTAEIGLQKALGANGGTIMFQYLAESSAISLAGGIAGIALVALIGIMLPSEAVHLELTTATVFKSLLTALSIGIFSGLSPAWNAAKLPPAVALNKK